MKIKSRLFLGLIISSMIMLIISSCEKEIIDKSSKNPNTSLIHKWSLEACVDYYDSLAFTDKHKKQYYITGWATYDPDCLNYIIEAKLYLSFTSCEHNNNQAKSEPNQSSVIHIQRKQKMENIHVICIDNFDFQIDNLCSSNENAKMEILHSLIHYMDRTYLN